MEEGNATPFPVWHVGKPWVSEDALPQLDFVIRYKIFFFSFFILFLLSCPHTYSQLVPFLWNAQGAN
ncbi:hypothetical protein COU13_01630 [Candidatus Kaiserbacteria bacterium CG10_big_fil_rev_8_21_14_0_10_43_70]|uniref:Uncharacterized protein n=1 Tax=Candidatus Kaiserbacteria bacterium CG10_big_fil_rev_8_21_14_0_10_43_70 TaxID=1974605 RepID=A0A2H0UIU1_9BACT|nr:MAG: hypothetical protein COU13_01630 [Candidatus Kaiserbacteria bacterium CG10_big_fil_rev_8_21_14_0_10_43_70]